MILKFRIIDYDVLMHLVFCIVMGRDLEEKKI